MAQATTRLTEEKILKLVECLSDVRSWNWTRMRSDRDAADAVLMTMSELDLIEYKEHPLGGHVWIVGDRTFGRVD